MQELNIVMGRERRTPPVEAVLITPSNALAVAAWCGGSIETIRQITYVRVPTRRPNTLPVGPGWWVIRIKDNDGVRFSFANDASFHDKYDIVGDFHIVSDT